MGNDKSARDEAMVSDPIDGHADPHDLFVEEELANEILMEAAGPWRTAEALKALRSQVNRAFPRRSKASDGTVGDPSHQSRKSDHNPWIRDGGVGVVSAIDITHDPGPMSGCDANKIVAALHASRDRRIKYLIWNRRIASSSAIGSVPAWTWRSYSGPNPHDHHFHLSVKADKALYDDGNGWMMDRFEEAAAAERGADINVDVNAALSALGQSVDPEAPALPQLVAMQDALTQLFANYAADWAPSESNVVIEAAAPFSVLKPKYEALFASASIRHERKSIVAWHLKKLRKGRERYEEVQAATGAPWWFIGIVHAMEAAFSFDGHLHNGDPLTARTVQVPRNRPETWNPPSDWLSSAVDAIVWEKHANQQDWSLARTLHRFEQYNGFGYHAKNVNSPYLWSFTNHYSKGKYVRDHKYDPNFVSKQCGAATMLLALANSGDVSFGS